MGEAWERTKAFNSCLRSIPKFYAKQNERWHNHELQFKMWLETNSVAQIATVRQQKMAILSSLAGNATRAIELHGPGKPSFESDISAEDFLTVVRGVFLPKAESNLSRMDFEQYRQGADEPISEYATTKLALYHSSEPNQAARSYSYLRSEMLQGIYSGYVKNEVIRMNPTGEAGLLDAMITALGQAREAYQLGVGVVPNLDGLASTTRMITGSMENSGHQGGVEPMEIGQINDKKCFKCNRPGHFSRECRATTSQRGTGARPQGTPGRSKLTCYYCKKTGHKQDDCFKKKRDQGQKTGQNKRPGVRKTQDEEDDEEEDDLEEWEQEEENIAKLESLRISKPRKGFWVQAAAQKGSAYRL